MIAIVNRFFVSPHVHVREFGIWELGVDAGDVPVFNINRIQNDGDASYGDFPDGYAWLMGIYQPGRRCYALSLR